MVAETESLSVDPSAETSVEVRLKAADKERESQQVRNDNVAVTMACHIGYLKRGRRMVVGSDPALLSSSLPILPL